MSIQKTSAKYSKVTGQENGKEDLYEEGAWGKPAIDGTDQRTFGSQRNHEPWQNV
jgi:hypothetical protein